MPKEGATVQLTKNNIALYRKLIRDYELKTLSYENGMILIDDEPVNQYTFAQDSESKVQKP